MFLPSKALRHEDVYRSGYICIPDFDTIWRRVFSITPLPLYPRGNNPQNPLDRSLSGLQNRSRRLGEEKNHTLTGTRSDQRNRLEAQHQEEIKGADQSSKQEASKQRTNQDTESTRKWRAYIVKEIVVTTSEVENKNKITIRTAFPVPEHVTFGV
jgi:hypothetical protein